MAVLREKVKVGFGVVVDLSKIEGQGCVCRLFLKVLREFGMIW